MEGLIFPSGIGFVLSARSETTSTAGIEPGLLEETDGYGSRVVPKINKQLVLIGPPGIEHCLRLGYPIDISSRYFRPLRQLAPLQRLINVGTD